MAGYVLKITKGSDVIELNTTRTDAGSDVNDITDVVFKMNTIDDDVLNKDDSIRAELTIKGQINETNKDMVMKLAEWAMDTNQETIYRNVELLVRAGANGSGKILRNYKIDSMFVIDYQEFFGKAADGKTEQGSFELFMAQKEGNHKKTVSITL